MSTRLTSFGRVPATRSGGATFAGQSLASGVGLHLRADVGYNGTTWTDQSGHGRSPTNATAGKRPAAATDGSGRAVVRFAGASNRWLAFNDATVCPSYTVMVCAAFDVTQLASSACIYGNRPWGKGSAQTVALFGLNGAQRPELYENDAAPTTDFVATYDPALTLGSPTILTWTAGSGRRRSYVNGFQIAADLSAQTNLSTRAFAQFIGGEDGGAQFGGDIYRIVVWDRVPTPHERALSEQVIADDLGLSAGRLPQIVFDGDSITQAISPGFSTLVAETETLLATAPAARAHRTTNVALSGQTVATMTANAPYQISLAPYSRRNVLVMLGGHNTLKNTGTAAATEAEIAAYASWARKAGFLLLVGTILPGTDLIESERVLLNTWIRSTFGADVIDFASDPDMGQAGQYTNVAFFNIDRVHPNAGGWARMATYVNTRLRAALV